MTSDKPVCESVTGARRHRVPGRGRYDLLSPFATERVAKLYEHGAIQKEFGARNWEKGFPFSWCIDSIWRHLIKAMMREPDTEHDDNWAAIVFGANCIMDFEERIKRGLLPVELDDMPRYDCAELRHPTGPGGQHRVYVAGPFTGDGTLEDRDKNTMIACAVGDVLKRMGHLVHVPHSATAPFDGLWQYEDFMDLDLSIIKCWATAVYRRSGDSPGASREEERARAIGCPVWRCLADVPRTDKTTVCMSDDLLSDILLDIGGGVARVESLFGSWHQGIGAFRGALGLTEEL